MFRLITCLLLVVAVAGCATPGFRQSGLRGVPPEDIVHVRMDVLLERSFVRATSSYGGGAAAMVLLVGPFSANVMRLYGTVERFDTGGKITTLGTFSKQLNWGENSFIVVAAKNSDIKLKLRAGGTRKGMTDVGTVGIGSEPQQTVVVNFTEAGVDIQ